MTPTKCRSILEDTSCRPLLKRANVSTKHGWHDRGKTSFRNYGEGERGRNIMVTFMGPIPRAPDSPAPRFALRTKFTWCSKAELARAASRVSRSVVRGSCGKRGRLKQQQGVRIGPSLKFAWHSSMIRQWIIFLLSILSFWWLQVMSKVLMRLSELIHPVKLSFSFSFFLRWQSCRNGPLL